MFLWGFVLGWLTWWLWTEKEPDTVEEIDAYLRGERRKMPQWRRNGP